MHLPDATYRLQFRNGMDFAKAVELIPHFVGLGVSHLYASPLFTAVRGSTHGYDIVCYDEIDPSLGGYDGFVRLVHTLKVEGLGLVLDIVPNHMAAHLENDWWHSVIEWGRVSEFADHFDIDWGAPLTLPFLGRSFEDEVAAGNLRLAYDHERRCLALDYYGALYPLNPATYAAIPRSGNAVLERIAAIAGTAERKTAAQFHAEIAAVVATPSLAAELDQYLARLSADKQQLGRLHRMQSWQLMNWREARDKLSYRRFFEIAGLVGMRVEDDAVFADTHRLTLALVREGLVDGLRIDHIDGLADPKGYLDRLREETGDGTYIIVEKILGENETLPAGWPVEGTTGYEFISALADLLSDDTPSSWLSSEQRRSAAEAAVTGCKLQVLGRNFNTEVRRLTGLVARFTGNGAPDRDEQTGEAIRRLIAALPVYRTYVGDQGAGAGDGRILDEIAAKAAARAPAAGDETATIISAFKAPIDSLGGKLPAEFRTRFQQLSGAVMAKAVEDTFFYRRGDYLAANEVGASPFWSPGGVGRFHAMMQDRASQMPYGLSATSTHDTKRGEDARARLYVISEASDVWTAAMERWHGMNAASIFQLPDGDELEDSVEQFLYQSLLGAWPIEPLVDEGDLISLRERMIAFTVKALREAKLRTSWEDPNERYEAAIKAFLGDLLDWGNRSFLGDFANTAGPFIQAGLINSLTQTLVKLTAPGIPDIYQGSERADLSLVDPDNRRGFSPHASLPQLLRSPMIADFENCKQALISIGLTYRRGRGRDCLAEATYLPVPIEGPGARHAAAFIRRNKDKLALTVVPRLVFGRLEGNRLSVDPELWQNTFLVWPEGCELKPMRNLLTGGVVEPRALLDVAGIFRDFPAALLVDA
ncbi:malto-oligosyltrehalose synthase [Sinorhizobium medicae]|uniref:Malto-oligosyltrehalose synthase n=1 Tax=Sinorhizobium medicae (strain WSM419) TaxID=366394 RepID=A6UH86_SINMW|nr:malto-oligosyltrehalose synthase [Sinorhizobium medicae]ABR63016.1 malto-oligosyltrehalose synthase [Sinorhizobium medicae WSM419]MDX0435743.1 malto-oligosyltrehalose synthase [Sinorhizobium medicae]MDX0613788.1 malto-oligosyltrehalose synthase [Sinorhizobium medicae]MDX0624962.1 malto-oligosyltrehalose synthase [Sinorhizobium medicae]MDX0650702.1 malto-oligosyltrehalose synthase [Sinorhizobium medicae]